MIGSWTTSAWFVPLPVPPQRPDRDRVGAMGDPATEPGGQPTMTRERKRPETAEPMPCWDAKPCPFCGWVPSIQIRADNLAKVRIACDGSLCDIAPSVTADTKPVALRRWNHRFVGGKEKPDA